MPSNDAVKVTMRSVDAVSTWSRDALFWDWREARSVEMWRDLLPWLVDGGREG